MTEQAVHCYLTELRPEHFDPAGHTHQDPPGGGRFKITSICQDRDPDSAEVWSQIGELRSKEHQKTAIAALLMLVKVAQSGQPFTQSFDKKAIHETHSFHCQYSGKLERIWRYRRGDIRVLFYYAQERVVLLGGVVIKLSDRLTKSEKAAAERAVERFLVAQGEKALRWV